MIASPNTFVYCGGLGFETTAPLVFRSLFRGLAVDDSHRLDGVPLLHPLKATLFGGREALAFDGRDVNDDRAVSGQCVANRLAQSCHVVTVDHTGIGEVELLQKSPGAQNALTDSLN